MVTKLAKDTPNKGKGSVLAKIFMVTKQKVSMWMAPLCSVLAKIFMVTKLNTTRPYLIDCSVLAKIFMVTKQYFMRTTD